MESRIVEVASMFGLDDYAGFVSFADEVRALRAEARSLAAQLAGRRVWMLSSTMAGGGVAEMMPRVVSLLRELGVATEWIAMRPARAEFFALTKRLHNLLHGSGDPDLRAEDRALYEAVSETCASEIAARVAPGDIVVAHDPQPLGAAAIVKRRSGAATLWRCHVGIDEKLPATEAAWEFLRPYASAIDHTIFSAPEYIRDYLAGRSSVMYPAIDPLTHKNRELAPGKLIGILCAAGLLTPAQPVLTPPFQDQVRRLRSDGAFVPAAGAHEIGLPFRPTITQISRWDRLKGFGPLMEAFCRMKLRLRDRSYGERDRRRLEIVRLVLAGADPEGVADDPEARGLLDELSRQYRALPSSLQDDIAIVMLPMTSRKFNALMVNSLQRCATIVAQGSLREAFGLCATEAMWKSVAVLGTRATGLRLQIRDGLDGRLVREPGDPAQTAELLEEMLCAPKQRLLWGRSARRRVHDQFLIFNQVSAWLHAFARSPRR